jgi:hypothetical protein
MQRCWTLDGNSRPTFQQISDEIQIFMSGETEEQNVGESTPLQDNNVVTAGEMV